MSSFSCNRSLVIYKENSIVGQIISIQNLYESSRRQFQRKKYKKQIFDLIHNLLTENTMRLWNSFLLYILSHVQVSLRILLLAHPQERKDYLNLLIKPDAQAVLRKKKHISGISPRRAVSKYTTTYVVSTTKDY